MRRALAAITLVSMGAGCAGETKAAREPGAALLASSRGDAVTAPATRVSPVSDAPPAAYAPATIESSPTQPRPGPISAREPQRAARVEIEEPYRLDQRVVPQDRAAFLVSLRDRERWNRGGLGDLKTELPPVPGHPQPKVIVDVLSAKGGHKASDVQREARRLFWIHVVTCYGATAYKEPALRSKVKLRFQLSRSGKATGVRAIETRDEPLHTGGAEVAKCLETELAKLPLPKARSGSIVVAEVQVGPGDEPIPPPAAELVAGAGAVDTTAVRDAVRARLPDFEACYARATEYAPSLWGRLGVRFHVTAKGKVDEAFEAESRFPDERVTLCALRVARGLALPAPKGGDARFVVPLRFGAAPE